MKRLVGVFAVSLAVFVPSAVWAQQQEGEAETNTEESVAPLQQQDEDEVRVEFEDDNDDEKEDEAEGYFGIIGGPGLTNIAGDQDDFDTVADERVGYSLGLQGSFQFNDAIGLSPQLLFSRRGWEPGGGELFGDDYMFSYLDLPLLLRLSVPIGDVIQPKLLLGPHASLFLDGERGEGTDNPFDEDPAGVDIESDEVNSIQFGATAGVGVDFDLDDAGMVTTDLRFVRNFSGIFERPDDADEDQNVYHQSWNVMVGFMF